jgi:hypothetical protein
MVSLLALYKEPMLITSDTAPATEIPQHEIKARKTAMRCGAGWVQSGVVESGVGQCWW